MIPVALPGLVIGLAYIFFFNPKRLGGWRPVHSQPVCFMYGTMAILVLSTSSISTPSAS
jgi:iron(III) transport system permease protein